MKMTDYNKCLMDYFKYISSQRGYTDETIATYCYVFIVFHEFMLSVKHIEADHMKLCDINEKTVREFLDWLENVKNVQPGTRNHRLSVIRSFYKYVSKIKPALFNTYTEIRSIENKKAPKGTISYLPEEELENLMKYLKMNKSPKDLMLALTFYEPAARVSELINMKIGDFNLKGAQPFVIIFGKEQKTRKVPLTLDFAKKIEKYIIKTYDSHDKNTYLFTSNRNTKYTRQAINKKMNEWLKDLKVMYPDGYKDGLHPHLLRHTRATHLYMKGMDLLELKYFLGHESVMTTEMYASPDISKVRDSIIKSAGKITAADKYSKNDKDKMNKYLKNLAKKSK